jgi:hypothetical protein
MAEWSSRPNLLLNKQPLLPDEETDQHAVLLLEYGCSMKLHILNDLHTASREMTAKSVNYFSCMVKDAKICRGDPFVMLEL